MGTVEGDGHRRTSRYQCGHIMVLGQTKTNYISPGGAARRGFAALRDAITTKD